MKFTVQQLKTRLDKFLAEHSAEISRSRIQRDIESGHVTVNSEVVTSPNFVVRKDDAVTYEFVPDAEPRPVNLPLKTLYNNHGLLIIDKPAGLAVHPGAGFKGDSLSQALLFHFKDIYSVGEEGRNGIVHRLDKDTSGVIMVALTQEMYNHLKDSFSNRAVRKEYIALVKGNIKENHGFIEKPLGKSKKDFRKYTTDESDMVLSKPSLTEYTVLERLQFSNNSASIGEFNSQHVQPKLKEIGAQVPLEEGNTSWVSSSKSGIDYYTIIRVKLHTGRTHQIRVHLSSLGFPIIGDELYGGKNVMKLGLARQFLHAMRIEVQLPDQSWVEAKSKLPTDLRQLLKQLHSKEVSSL